MKKIMILAAIALTTVNASAQTFLANSQVPAALQSQIVQALAASCAQAHDVAELGTSVKVTSEDQGVRDYTFTTVFGTSHGATITVVSAQYAISNPSISNIEILGVYGQRGLCK